LTSPRHLSSGAGEGRSELIIEIYEVEGRLQYLRNNVLWINSQSERSSLFYCLASFSGFAGEGPRMRDQMNSEQNAEECDATEV
jgi:hypothetical protein